MIVGISRMQGGPGSTPNSRVTVMVPHKQTFWGYKIKVSAPWHRFELWVSFGFSSNFENSGEGRNTFEEDVIYRKKVIKIGDNLIGFVEFGQRSCPYQRDSFWPSGPAFESVPNPSSFSCHTRLPGPWCGVYSQCTLANPGTPLRDFTPMSAPHSLFGSENPT